VDHFGAAKWITFIPPLKTGILMRGALAP